MEKIYFDNNATTPLAPVVREKMLPYLGEFFGNPSSGHRFGEQTLAGINTAREQVASLFNCPPKRLFFSGGYLPWHHSCICMHHALLQNTAGEKRKIIFWVASRGHHADIGGISPGSMPPGSRRLVEEGEVDAACRGFVEEEALVDIVADEFR